jgi:hypothetical protein
VSISRSPLGGEGKGLGLALCFVKRGRHPSRLDRPELAIEEEGTTIEVAEQELGGVRRVGRANAGRSVQADRSNPLPLQEATGSRPETHSGECVVNGVKNRAGLRLIFRSEPAETLRAV